MSPPTPIDLSSGIVGNSAAPGAPAAPGADLSAGIVGETAPTPNVGDPRRATAHMENSTFAQDYTMEEPATMDRNFQRDPHSYGVSDADRGTTADDVEGELGQEAIAGALGAVGGPGARTAKATYEGASGALKPITDIALEQWQFLKSNPRLYTEWAVHQAVKWTVAHPKQAAELAGLTSGLAAAVKYLSGAGKKD
jgi:hypothetical protein